MTATEKANADRLAAIIALTDSSVRRDAIAHIQHIRKNAVAKVLDAFTEALNLTEWAEFDTTTTHEAGAHLTTIGNHPRHRIDVWTETRSDNVRLSWTVNGHNTTSVLLSADDDTMNAELDQLTAEAAR